MVSVRPLLDCRRASKDRPRAAVVSLPFQGPSHFLERARDPDVRCRKSGLLRPKAAVEHAQRLLVAACAGQRGTKVVESFRDIEIGRVVPFAEGHCPACSLDRLPVLTGDDERIA